MMSTSLKCVMAGVFLLCLCIIIVPANAAFTITTTSGGASVLGDDITFMGSTDETNTVYLFVTGPNLPANGAQIASIDPKNNPVVDENPATFLKRDVPAGNQWFWTWHTQGLNLDAGTYTVYGLTEPRDKNNLAATSYATYSLILKKPFSSPVINPGNTVFIGEEGLDITSAMAGNPYIAWWSPGKNPNLDPVEELIYVESDLTNFYVAPATFVGHTGNWYQWTALGPNAVAFVVADPALDLQILDSSNAIVSGSSVPRGTDLKFRIQTNMYVTYAERNEKPVIIKVKDPDGVPYASLYNNNPGLPNAGPFSLSQNTIDTPSWDWGQTAGNYWNTHAAYNNQYIYPAGTYLVLAESRLNKMKDNYKNAGADYTGKTVSPGYTVTIVDLPPPVSIHDAYTKVKTSLAIDESKIKVSTSVLLPAGSAIRNWQGQTQNLPAYPGYLIFIDDNPEANWEHPCRYAYVKADDKDVFTVYNDRTPPTNIALSYHAGVIPNPYGSRFPPFETPVPTPIGTPVPGNGACTPDASNNYALLIAGGVDPVNNNVRYYNDIRSMYITLNSTYNYPKDHIWVLVSDGIDPGLDQHVSDTKTAPITPVLKTSTTAQDFAGSTIGNARKTTVINTLTSIRSKLKSTDNLFIFTTNHGGSTTTPVTDSATLYLWLGDTIKDTEFVGALPTGINSITMMMQQCHGGGFVNEFITGAGTQKRVIATAADWDESSWGDAFSYPWITGVANPVPADTNDGRASMSEAFTYAKDRDTYAAPAIAKETPQFATANIDGTAQYLAGCSAAAKIDVTSPAAGNIWYMGNTHTLTWTQTGLPSGTVVNIELRKGTSETLVKSIPPVTMTSAILQSTSWTIPTVTAGTDYIIKIVTTDGKVTGRSPKFTLKPAGVNGNIRVTTTPVTGAEIFLDSVDQHQVTDYTFPARSINPGTHKVNVTLQGYYPVGSGVTVLPGLTALVPLQLDPVAPNDCAPFGKIVVTSSPVLDAKVLIDGKYKGANTNAEIGIAPGTYTVTVEHDDYATPAAQTVTIGPCGQERTEYVRFNFVPEDVNIPEFPTTIISVTMITGLLATIFYIRSTRKH